MKKARSVAVRGVLVALASGAALAFVAASAGATASGTTPAAADDSLPRSLELAPAWTATLNRAPIGRAFAVYSRMDQVRLTLIGPGDAIRVYDRPEWSFTSDDAATMYLSPGGRRLAMPHWPTSRQQFTRILDVTDGSVRVIRAGAPLAWSADARQLLVAHFDSDPSVDEPRGGEVRVVDADTGRIRWSAPLPPRPMAIAALTGAFSPDGTAIAVQQADSLTLHRTDGSGWRVTLDSRRLAGPAAWTPDGRTLLVMDRTGRLHGLDTASGRPTATPAIEGRPGSRLVGWRGGAPVVVDGHRVRLLGAEPAVLAEAPDDTLELQVATDAVALPLRDPGSPQVGPFTARYQTPLVTGGAALIIAGAAWLWIRLRRNSTDSSTVAAIF
ncbi:hypothetical protein F4553_006476 [Allocatelliglobosispora scoriae]|uniref:WD40 repeat domain-containing protein n=1 Tax=Allocatelliglobosispora scoriae TaxID=643052 RepID=A0A841C1V8_9ACTN|nr:PQQ-binding-like beta-propeller repeat protein [Allocatelliglobosispora scoriae]MBB5873042.1 hypothetical protein [Allocatelliglobosispora scoriae]